jgi:hypothetical protein
MKRKSPARTESPVAPEILEEARRALTEESAANALSAKRLPRCIVCDGEATPATSEQLCWVCRRLKISAWRDSEQQAPVQE